MKSTHRHGIHESALAAGRRSAGAAAAPAAAAAADMAANLSASLEVEVEVGAPQDRNLPALLFGVLLIVVIICGNLLVCLSVLTEKALKTTTNYFIVSLAVADLMLAVLVLPLFVYSEVRKVGASFIPCERNSAHRSVVRSVAIKGNLVIDQTFFKHRAKGFFYAFKKACCRYNSS